MSQRLRLSLQKLREAAEGLEIFMEQTMMFQGGIPDYSHRYMERHGEFEIRTYKSSVETIGHGKLGEQPEWLKRIVDVAYLGDHIQRVPNPPPDRIMWFTTDPDLNLVSFLPLKPNHV